MAIDNNMGNEPNVADIQEGNLDNLLELYLKKDFGESADERLKAEMEYNRILNQFGDDKYSVQKALQEKASEAGLFDSSTDRMQKMNDIDMKRAKAKMISAGAADLLKTGGSIYQIARGLKDARDANRPEFPLPQENPALKQRLFQAQQEASMVDPELQEAREKAAIQGLNAAKEAFKTGSAGQPGAYASNMQLAVNNMADTMRKGAFEDEQLQLQKQRAFDDVLRNKLYEDRFMQRAKENKYNYDWQDFAYQRAAGNQLAQTGFANLANMLGAAPDYADLMGEYQMMKIMASDQGQPFQREGGEVPNTMTASPMNQIPQNNTAFAPPNTPPVQMNMPVQPNYGQLPQFPNEYWKMGSGM